MVSLAQQYLGVPYVYGGSSASGFDCSGFTMYVFSLAGVSLPHGATSQLSYGTEVSRSDLQPGDLVFFQDYGAVASHVGIYIGSDQFIHASSSYYNGHCVVISSLTETYYNNHYYTPADTELHRKFPGCAGKFFAKDLKRFGTCVVIFLKGVRK